MIYVFFDMASTPFIARWSARFARFSARLNLLATTNRERRDLHSLDDRLLRDIGVSREDATRESNRAYWDVPAERLADRSESLAPQPLHPIAFLRPLS